MEWILTGLTFGFLGSFHCIGMCGPIALALPLKSKEKLYYVGSRLTYNLGRVLTYATLGAIVGFFSNMISISGYQQSLSIAMGGLLLLSLGWKQFRALIQKMEALPTKFIGNVTKRIKQLFGQGGYGPLFLIGLLNGLLPCGFVYMALATALTFGSIEGSLLFMTGFGLGTIPAMLGISLAGGLISVGMRQKLQKLSPYFIAIVGIILILRGLNLGIPFISPVIK
jgi:sulfite exporter TauE/SafE